MEGAAYPPPTGQPGYQPPPQPPGYYPAPQQFKSDGPPPYGAPPPQGYAPPPQGYAPPVGYAPAPVPQQQTSNNVVVVNSQPTPVIASTVIRPVGDHFLTLSIVLTILCFLCGTWTSLFCTIPAIVFATMARDADSRGDADGARTHGYLALGCNIGGIVGYVLVIVAAIVAIAVSVNSGGGCYYYYSYTYDTYRTYC